MTFSKYACWKPEMIRKVMDFEAIKPEDHIFLATHSPIKMYCQKSRETDSKEAYTEQQFFDDFLRKTELDSRSILVFVLGTSGTGKSHLIRWLYTRIRSTLKTPKYKVLLIPRVGTNLRDVIGLILKDMEGNEFDEYRNRLERATNNLTEAEAQEQLLANLAIAIGPSGQHNHSSLSEVQNELINSLPALLFDPYFRKTYWLKEGSIIQKLVVHALGHRNSREEDQTQFSLEDLPRDVRDIPKASEQARDFYSFLISDTEVQKEVVKWLNQHLDEAIAKVLNLGREDLVRLMLDVRRALARQGVELILLIEDFFKLQGIDRGLLAAIIERGPDLCAMRTALACTEGYFKTNVDDTVKTRIDFKVNLDVETINEQSIVRPADVQQLAVRYLNAVRLPDQAIRDWLANVDEETGDPPPSACTDCKHQSSCHAGFGAVDGMGLYPFNATALERMRERIIKGVFKPRTLINDVLIYILEYHRSELEQGRFPSPLLLQHFGGSKLNAMLRNDIKAQDPLNADRREALLNLWADGRELCNLSQEVHLAFNLPPLVIIDPDPSPDPDPSFDPDPSPDPVSDPKPDSPLPDRLVGFLDALDQWGNGIQLPQEVTTQLRPKIYSAISEYIDWDAELLLRNHVVGKDNKDKLFRASRSINFSNAATYSQVSGIELLIPLSSNDLGDTVIALQALLLYDYHQHWNFPDGAKYFRKYAKKLEEWSRFVLHAVPKCSTKSGVDGDPVPATVELLAIAGCIANNPSNSLEDLCNLLFADLEKVNVANRAASWQKLFGTLKKHQPHLREILDSRIPCTKGGASKFQIIDAAQLIEPLQSISSGWQPQVNVIDVSSDKPFKAIIDARKAVDELLEQAIQEERGRHLDIYQRVITSLGEEFSQKEVAEVLKTLIEQARASGLAGGVNLNSLTSAIEEFEKTKLKAYLNNLKKLNEHEDGTPLLPLLSSLSDRPPEVLTNFLDAVQQFLTKVQENIQRELQNLRSTDSGKLEISYQGIESSLLALQNSVSEIKGELSCS